MSFHLRKHDVEFLLSIAKEEDGKDGPNYLQDELSEGHPDVNVIKALCEAYPSRASVERISDKSVALHIACFNTNVLKNKVLLKMLVDAYPEGLLHANQFRYIPLHKAACIATSIHIESIQYLIESAPESLQFMTKDGMTPLHLAVSVPKLVLPDIVQIFLEASPDIAQLADSYGQYALHKAAAKTKIDIEVLKLLIQHAPIALQLKDSKG